MFFGDDEAPALYRKAADGAAVNNGTTLKSGSAVLDVN
jgi:hypothetical protein